MVTMETVTVEIEVAGEKVPLQLDADIEKWVETITEHTGEYYGISYE